MKTIFENDDFIVDYDEANNEYRVSYFEDNHFVDDCKFSAFVRHGEWIEHGNWFGHIEYKCSSCGDTTFDASEMCYCPWCGARMNGGKGNDQ